MWGGGGTPKKSILEKNLKGANRAKSRLNSSKNRSRDRQLWGEMERKGGQWSRAGVSTKRSARMKEDVQLKVRANSEVLGADRGKGSLLTEKGK